MRIHTELERTSVLIENLMTLARADSGSQTVQLTSIDLNSTHMGKEAANLALRAIRERSQKAAHAPIAILLRPTLVVRESTVHETRLKDRPRPR